MGSPKVLVQSFIFLAIQKENDFLDRKSEFKSRRVVETCAKNTGIKGTLACNSLHDVKIEERVSQNMDLFSLIADFVAESPQWNRRMSDHSESMHGQKNKRERGKSIPCQISLAVPFSLPILLSTPVEYVPPNSWLANRINHLHMSLCFGHINSIIVGGAGKHSDLRIKMTAKKGEDFPACKPQNYSGAYFQFLPPRLVPSWGLVRQSSKFLSCSGCVCFDLSTLPLTWERAAGLSAVAAADFGLMSALADFGAGRSARRPARSADLSNRMRGAASWPKSPSLKRGTCSVLQFANGNWCVLRF